MGKYKKEMFNTEEETKEETSVKTEEVKEEVKEEKKVPERPVLKYRGACI